MAESFPKSDDPRDRPVSANPAPEEAREYEQLVRDAAREALLERDVPFDPKTYRAVELVGSYPHTELLIDFNHHDGRPGREAFPLWGEDAFPLGRDLMEAPHSVVGVVLANLLEA